MNQLSTYTGSGLKSVKATVRFPDGTTAEVDMDLPPNSVVQSGEDRLMEYRNGQWVLAAGVE